MFFSLKNEQKYEDKIMTNAQLTSFKYYFIKMNTIHQFHSHSTDSTSISNYQKDNSWISELRKLLIL